MKLELRFRNRSGLLPAQATIVLNCYNIDEDDPRPNVTDDCESMAIFEGELRRIEMQLAKIRAEAKRKFLATGISN
jgi:hypothetical protein